MKPRERDRQRRERGQLTDKEGRWERGRNRKKKSGKRKRDMAGRKNAEWRDEGIKKQEVGEALLMESMQFDNTLL